MSTNDPRQNQPPIPPQGQQPPRQNQPPIQPQQGQQPPRAGQQPIQPQQGQQPRVANPNPQMPYARRPKAMRTAQTGNILLALGGSLIVIIASFLTLFKFTYTYEDYNDDVFSEEFSANVFQNPLSGFGVLSFFIALLTLVFAIVVLSSLNANTSTANPGSVLNKLKTNVGNWALPILIFFVAGILILLTQIIFSIHTLMTGNFLHGIWLDIADNENIVDDDLETNFSIGIGAFIGFIGSLIVIASPFIRFNRMGNPQQMHQPQQIHQ